MAHDVFICYSTHDKRVTEEVCAALEARHIRCWMAPRDVSPGMEWAEAIVDAVDGSRVLVLVLSSNSNSSSQVIREVGRAASKDIPIIPLRIDDVSLSKAMEFFVSAHHFFDAQAPPLSKHLQQLADAVQKLLTREGVLQEARKAKEAEERAEREAELVAKEREKREVREAREKAKREAEAARKTKEAEERAPVFVERPAEPVKVKPLLKRRWLWVGAAVVLVALVFLFVFVLGETAAEQHYKLGVALLEEGQYSRAILEFDKATDLDTNYAAAYHSRGIAYQLKGEYRHEQTGEAKADIEEWDMAIADHTRAIELDPNNAGYYGARGNTYHKTGESSKSIADYTRAIVLDPNNATHFYSGRGWAYNMKGEIDLAIADLTKAIELDSNHANAYDMRGKIYFVIGEYDLAIADHIRAIELEPNDASYYAHRGYVYEAQGKNAEAIADFERVIELSQNLLSTQEAQQALERLRD